MRLFVTGATGFIGSATVRELLGAGHHVVGLTRSEAGAAALADAGVEVRRGTLDDLAGLRDGAAESDGVIHLAFVHDFANFAAAAQADASAIAALGDALAGSGRPLVIASGLLGVAPGRVATERDLPAPGAGGPRADNAAATLALAGRGVRPAVVRLAPSVHDVGDRGFVAALIGIARERGVSGYIGEGANRWAAVHRRDAARLFRLAAEAAPAGSTLHGVGEEGLPTREIAETIGRHLGLPTVSIDPDRAGAHFGWMAPFFGADLAASSAITRRELGWEPGGPGLLADLDAGHYFQ